MDLVERETTHIATSLGERGQSRGDRRLGGLLLLMWLNGRRRLRVVPICKHFDFLITLTDNGDE